MNYFWKTVIGNVSRRWFGPLLQKKIDFLKKEKEFLQKIGIREGLRCYAVLFYDYIIANLNKMQKWFALRAFNHFTKKNGSTFWDHTQFGIGFGGVTFFVFFIAYDISPNWFVINRANLSWNMLVELNLFIFLFLCFLYYFGPIKKFKGSRFIHAELKRAFINNILSIFFVYAAILGFNLAAYTSPAEYGSLWKLFLSLGVNLHSHDYAYLSIKIFYLFMCLIALHIIGKYFTRLVVDFQYVCLSVLAMWGGLFSFNLDSIFMFFILFDAVSLITVSITGNSGQSDEETTISLSNALHYFFFSALTSAIGYGGCILLYTTLKTMDVSAIMVLAGESLPKNVFENKAFFLGIAMIMIKVLFFLGAVPFQYPTLEVSSRLNYGYLFLFLVVLKWPVLIFLIKLMKILWFKSLWARILLFLVGLSSMFFSAVLMPSADSIKQFLALSSANQTGFIITLFYFTGMDDYHIFISIFFYIVYAVASAALYFFFSTAKFIGFDGKNWDLDTWADLTYYVSEASGHYRFTSKFQPVLAKRNFSFHAGAFASFLALMGIAGLPVSAGFFAKFMFIEVLMANAFFLSLVLIVISTFATTYSYINVLIRLKADFGREKKVALLRRSVVISDTRREDFIIFSFLSFLMILLVLPGSSSIYFEVFKNFFSSFFCNESYYIIHKFMPDDAKVLFVPLFFIKLNGENSSLFKKTVLKNLVFLKNLLIKTLEAIMDPLRPWFYKTTDWIWFELHPTTAKSRFVFNSFSWDLAAVVSAITITFNLLVYFWDLTWDDQIGLRFSLAHWIVVYLVVSSVLGYCFNNVFLTRVFFFFYVLHEIYEPFNFFLLWVDFYKFFFTFIQELCGLPVNLVRAVEIVCQMWIGAFYFFWGSVFCFPLTVLLIGLINRPNDLLRIFKIKNITSAAVCKRLRFFIFKTFHLDVKPLFLNYLQFWLIFYALFWNFGPGDFGHQTGLTYDFLFFFKAVYYYFVVLTLKGVLVKALVWVTFGHYFYAWYRGLNSYEELGKYFRANFPDRAYQAFDDAGKTFAYFKYWCVAIFIPLAFVADFAFTSFFDVFYFPFIYFIQVVIFYWWIAALLLLAAFGGMRTEVGALCFLYTIYALSLSIGLFFLNLIMDYRANAAISLNASGKVKSGQFIFEPVSILDFDYFCLFDRFPFFKELIGKSLTLGYDYFSLVLCLMTSVVFSFVFLISLFNKRIKSKTLFFLILLVVELLTLLTFLSTNFVVFVIFFESTLLPMALLVGYWGSSNNKWIASKSFFFYSFILSTPALLASSFLYNRFGGKVDYLYLAQHMHELSHKEKTFLWLTLFLMFAVKMPLFPFHSWLLNAHVEAPTAGSIVLAAIMLKLGAYGFIRYPLGLLHDISVEYKAYVCALALFSVFFAAISSVIETDAKRLIAYTSIAHMGLVTIGLFTMDSLTFTGALLLIFGHAVTSTGLFYLIGILYDRFHTRDLTTFGGLVQLMPLFCTMLFFCAIANSGFPCSLSFMGELLILIGFAREWSLLAFGVLIISAVALFYSNMRMFMTISFGTLNEKTISNATSDLTLLEVFCSWLVLSHSLAMLYNNEYFFHLISSDVLSRFVN